MHDRRVLVLQGGGALGAYQAGAYEGMAEQGIAPDWIAGVSIGAINGALIAGNDAAVRLDRLREFWKRVSSGVASVGLADGAANPLSALAALVFGVPGFRSVARRQSRVVHAVKLEIALDHSNPRE